MSNLPKEEGYHWVRLEYMLRDGRAAQTWTVACMGMHGWWLVTGDDHPVSPDAVIELGPKIEPPSD